jgi:transcriptional regulator with XRE-family HTH domain
MLAEQIQAFFQERTRTLIRMSYGGRLQAAMDLAQIDRAELAKQIGISVQAIGQVIVGQTKALTAENSAKAARVLAVDHHWLATGEGEPRPALMKERASLTTEAIELAAEFSKLNAAEKHLWRTLVEAAKKPPQLEATDGGEAQPSGKKKPLGRFPGEVVRTGRDLGITGAVNKPGAVPRKRGR